MPRQKQLQTERREGEAVGARLSCVIDCRSENFKEEYLGVEPNEACVYIRDRILETLQDCDDPIRVPHRYLGINGFVKFNGHRFPPEMLGAVDQAVTSLLSLVAIGNAEVSTSLDDASISLINNNDFISIATHIAGLDQKKDHGRLAEQTELLEALFKDLPPDPKARVDAVVALQHAFRAKAADILGPAINHLLHFPPESFADKQTLSSHLNHAFHELGVAACEHGSDRPCILVAKRSSPAATTSYLRLRSKDAARVESRSTNELGQIELKVSPREEALSRFK